MELEQPQFMNIEETFTGPIDIYNDADFIRNTLEPTILNTIRTFNTDYQDSGIEIIISGGAAAASYFINSPELKTPGYDLRIAYPLTVRSFTLNVLNDLNSA